MSRAFEQSHIIGEVLTLVKLKRKVQFTMRHTEVPSTLPTMHMLARLPSDAHASEANDVYTHDKDSHNAYAIFQSRKTRKFIKNK